MEINITWNICRVCLKEEPKDTKNSNAGQLRPIFSDDKMPKQIYECSGITIKPNDSLPDKICPKCVNILKDAVNFRKTCRNSNTYLQSVLQRTKLASCLFKPDRSLDSEDENISDDSGDFKEKEKEQKEDDHDEHTQIKDESVERQKRKRSSSLISPKTSKKVKSIDSAPGIVKGRDKLDIESQIKTNEENFIAQKTKGHVAKVKDKAEHHKNKVEIEQEIVDASEELIEQMFNDTTEENLQTNHAKTEDDQEIEGEIDNENEDSNKDRKFKQSTLQEFYQSSNYAKLSVDNLQNKVEEGSEDENNEEYDIIETHETDTQNSKPANQDIYYILKDIKNENRTLENSARTDDNYDDNSHLNEEGHINETEEGLNHGQNEETENDNDGFMPSEGEEDEIMLEFEEDNQEQVTSTVITNDDDDNDGEEDNYNEHNSNSSDATQDLPTEYIIDEYFVEESHSNISAETFQTPANQNNIKKSSIILNKKRNPVVSRQQRKNKTDANLKQFCVCIICGNHFNTRQLLNFHMKVHRQEKNHECEICLKRFITACNLQAHMRIHTGEKPFECQYCGRRFSDRSSNIRHERTHTNEKPFQCNHCGKAFALATTLQAHIKVHTNERSYRCDTCSKSFKLPHQLKAHLSTTLHKAVEQLVKLN